MLVTGGSKGVGRAVARRLGAAGCEVIVNYHRDAEAARETCRQVEAEGGAAEALAADVGDPEAVAAMFAAIRARRPRLDAIVHSAVVGRLQPLLRIRHAHWDLAMRTNAYGLVLVAREALGLLPEPGGRVVALSSLGSRRYVPFYGAIGPSKAALESAVRYLAVELAPRGIRVNAVSGGMVESDAATRFPRAEAIRAAAVQRTPANRLGTPEELADVVLFLLSERSSWIYGQTLVADGGFSLL